jgi:hypothetical protein
MSLIDNERTKLLANALDRASTACFTAGIFTPGAGYFYNVGGFQGLISVPGLLVGMFAWLGTVVVLHVLARRVLKGLLP